MSREMRSLLFPLFTTTAVLYLLGGKYAVVDAFSISGTGEGWSTSLYSSLATAYAYVEDDAAITYQTTSSINSSLAALGKAQLSFVSTPANLEGQATESAAGVVHSIPVLATATAISYNSSLFANSSASNGLILDVGLLVAIWKGTLTSWSDPRIAALNPWLGMPLGNVTMVYCNNTYGEGSVLRRFLSLCDSTLASLLSSPGGFASLEPVASGRAVSACTLEEKMSVVTEGSGSMRSSLVLLMLPDVSSSGLSTVSLMVPNSNGTGTSLVGPSTAGAVNNAMSLSGDGSDIVTNGTYGSWPLSTLVSVVVETDLTTVNNCYMVKYVLSFITWIQLNDGALSSVASFGYTALDSLHRRSMLDQVSNITCNGYLVLTGSYLLGSGPLFPVYPALATSYSSSSFTLKYYASTSSYSAITDMIDSALDFGTTGATLTAAQQALMPDAVLVPMLAYGFVMAYNLPELLAIGASPLVMDFELVAAIFMGTVDRWNHPNITALNPQMAHLLPAQPIIVLYIETPQVLTQTINTAISMEVPEYARLVGTSNAGLDYPVVELAPNRTLGVPNQNYLYTTLGEVPYLFSVCTTFIAFTTPNVTAVSLTGAFSSGNAVAPSQDNIVSAINHTPYTEGQETFFFAAGNSSWPIVATNWLIARTRSMTDCTKAAALADWVYWTQTDKGALDIADANQIIMIGSSDVMMRSILESLVNITCNGVAVSSLAGCVSNGSICSDHGSCYNKACVCSAGWQGTFCDSMIGSSGVGVLVPVLSSVLPVAAVVALLVLLGPFCVFYVFSWNRRRTRREDWEINVEEIEMGEKLGKGGFGEVYKAVWKGTDVAVKLVSSEREEDLSSSAVSSFVEEARLMSVLRHPNVVLFMAACTRPPRLAIVMEYMALGSLYDLLHNELIPELPLKLKVKLAHQAAKGMHFLHSSGIVHRDLKSLNLLLDNKWNIKVADFGLTRFKESIKIKEGDGQMIGSVPWMAPEVLSEEAEVDYFMADVYSFGIVLWELLMREAPYPGLSPANVAVLVIRNDERPPIPEEYEKDDVLTKYGDIVKKCWQRDIHMRPTFIEICNGLNEIKNIEDSIHSSITGTSSSSNSSYNAITRYVTQHDSRSQHASTSSADTSGRDPAEPHRREEQGRVPRRDVCYAVCDLASFNEVWSKKPSEAERAIGSYSSMVWKHSAANRGHVFSRPSHHSGGTFFVSFFDSLSAASFALALCAEAQRDPLLALHSRLALSHRPGTSVPPPDDHTCTSYDPNDYQESLKLAVQCPPGAVLCSLGLRDMCRSEDQHKRNERKENHQQAEEDTNNRLFFLDSQDQSCSLLLLASQDDHQQQELIEALEDNLSDGPSHKRAAGICSSNSCPWIIDSSKIIRGKRIGEGSYGQVDKGTYLGIPVAIKRLFNSRLNESAMRDMRKEAAILSDLNHPNIVKLIGLSPTDGNLLLVTELMPRGSLRAVLSKTSISIPWRTRVSLLRDAALGINYLHDQGIVHRDIKSSNLLVDEKWNLKVGDFGFATAKQDNGTMTRCGTPLWTAPEVLLPSKKSHRATEDKADNVDRDDDDKELRKARKADVYSFGVVMWEVLTRKLPYENKNMYGVIQAVLDGERPPVPPDCPKDFENVMRSCWHEKRSKRPSMESVFMFLNSEFGHAGV